MAVLRGQPRVACSTFGWTDHDPLIGLITQGGGKELCQFAFVTFGIDE